MAVLKQLQDDIKTAAIMLNELCSTHGKSWAMHVPVQHNDTDLVFSRLLEYAMELANRIKIEQGAPQEDVSGAKPSFELIEGIEVKGDLTVGNYAIYSTNGPVVSIEKKGAGGAPLNKRRLLDAVEKLYIDSF